MLICSDGKWPGGAGYWELPPWRRPAESLLFGWSVKSYARNERSAPRLNVGVRAACCAKAVASKTNGRGIVQGWTKAIV